MKLLELFSGTHSIGKVAKQKGYEVISLDRDMDDGCPFKTGYKSDKHIKLDILDWDYKKDYKQGDFDVITASPVCLWWSMLRQSSIGQFRKNIHPTDKITREHLNADIEKYGKPMVDKVFEIIDYFKPKYWWIENPQTGRMKEYIIDKPFYDVDYCKYSDWGYKKRTRFWTNIESFEPKTCKKDCDNIITIEGHIIHSKDLGTNQRNKLTKKHSKDIGGKFKTSNKYERYRIPAKLIEEFLDLCK